MANKEAMLDKIARNLKQRGVSAERVGDTVVVGSLTVSYEDKKVQSPMGGVDDSASPFLGVGIAAPGSLKISAPEADLGAIVPTLADTALMATADSAILLAECAGKANDIVLSQVNTNGGGESFSLRIPGHPTVLGLGE